jgi:pimeloyl-ACP methyl ester carboxylesterase
VRAGTLALITFAAVFLPRSSTAAPATPHTHFIKVNGVQLEYLDWGGHRKPLLFLAGQGDTPYIYNDLAPEFINHFRVLGLTRRGHGASEQAQNGYQLDNLVQDVASFINALHLRDVTIVGHSWGGVEAVRLSELHPDVVRRVVLLDTAYPPMPETLDVIGSKLLPALGGMSFSEASRSYEATREFWKGVRTKWPPEGGEKAWSDSSEINLRHALVVHDDGSVAWRSDPASDEMNKSNSDENAAHWNFTNIPVAALLIFAHSPFADTLPYLKLDGQTAAQILKASDIREKARRAQIEAFRRDSPKAKIVELDHTSHYCFIQRREAVLDEMLRFLR